MDAVSRITALDLDPRRPGAVRLEIDGARFGTVSRAVVDVEGLAVGTQVNGPLLGRLGTAADVEAAFRTALRCLQLRSYARHDLGRRLLRKGHPRPAVEAALERAEELRLLDDGAFARGYVQTRASRGRGPTRLTRDLLAMGVERALIDRAVADEWPQDLDRTSMALALARKRAVQLGSLPKQTKRRRLLAYLSRRGFSGRDVTELVENLL